MRAALAFLVLIVLVVVVVIVIGVLDERRHFNADCVELGAAYSWWVKKGRPDPSEGINLFSGYRDDLIVTQTSITVGGADFVTIFAIPIPNSSGMTGQLFVSTNGVLIYTDEEGQTSVVSTRF